jgi:hypothetical protein
VKTDIIVIKGGPGSEGARRGVELARDCVADILLREGGVLLAAPEAMEGFCGMVYAVREDMEARGVREVKRGVRVLAGAEADAMLARPDVALVETFK